MPLDAQQMAKIIEPYATTSDRIRALAAAGAPRAEIARFLGKRYQHVRNVLEGDAQSGGGYQLGRADLSGVGEEPARFDRSDEKAFVERRGRGAFWLRVRQDGSIYLPKEVMEALDAPPGERVFAKLEDGELKIISGERAMEQVREMVRKYVPEGVDVVESFLAERGAMWKRVGRHDE
jgi:hypothetical protein